MMGCGSTLGLWYKHLPYEHRPLSLLFGDNTEMSWERKQQFVDVYDKFGVPAAWQPGDLALVCNYRWAHGRPAIHLEDGEERQLGVMIGAAIQRVGQANGK